MVSSMQINVTTMEAIVAGVIESLLAREVSLCTRLGERVARPQRGVSTPISGKPFSSRSAMKL